MKLWTCGRFSVDLASPCVMGIVNLTPDSFSDGDRALTTRAALARAERAIDEGAAILDIGAESTRPGAAPVSLDEELARLMPVLAALRDAPLPISVDTYKPDVMRRALDAGASIVNDVFGFRQHGALEAVSANPCGVVAMHMQGTPETMHLAPHYTDVVVDVATFLHERVAALQAAGVASSRIVIDVGFGFGKRLEHNHELLARLSSFREFGVAGLLVGLSRKGMLGTITGRSKPADRLGSSIAAALLAVGQGAQIVRCHDVAATVDALKVWAYFSGGGAGAGPSLESN